MTDAPKTPADDEAAKAAKTTPPWERDGKPFDPERAWSLITALRGEVDDLKADRDAIKTERDAMAAEKAAAEDAKKDDLTRATDRLTAAEKAAADAQRTLWVERALRKYQLEDDDVDFLTGDTEDAITAKAERLAARGKARKDEGETPEPPTHRPAPALTPGHGGDAPVPFDPDAIAKAARQSAF